MERDDFRRKASTAEKYRMKLEAMQGLDEEVLELRSQLDEARTQAKSAEDTRQGLDRTIATYRQTLEGLERTIYELREVKQRLETDNHHLIERWTLMKDDRLRESEVISELHEQIRELEADRVVTNGNGTLDSQLARQGRTRDES